jgi:hypothetical protein
MASETVAPPRVLECPIQLEAALVRVNSVMADEYDYSQHKRRKECTLEGITCLEVRIQRVHVAPSLLMARDQNRIDPDLWRPMIMSFCRYYGLGPEIAHSKLAEIPEEQYRSPDVDRARLAPLSAGHCSQAYPARLRGGKRQRSPRICSPAAGARRPLLADRQQ